MRATALCLVLLVASGCQPPPEERALVFWLDSDALGPRSPFPSLRAHADGTLRIADWILEPQGLESATDRALGRDYLESLRPLLEELPGAGLTSVLRLPYSGEVDLESLADSIEVLDERGLNPTPVTVSATERWVEVAPVNTWLAGTDHVLVIRGDATDSSGGRCVTSDYQSAVLRGEIERAESDRIARALSGAGIDANKVCLAFAFRVQGVRERLLAMRRFLKDREHTQPPELVIDEVLTPDESEIWQNDPTNVAYLIHGHYASPALRDESGLIDPELLDGARPAPDEDIIFSLTLPKNAAGTVPVVMGLHGLSSNQDQTAGLYGPFMADNGYAYITIDGVAHGTRLSEDAISTFDALLDVRDPRRSRDVFAQTLIDLMQLRIAIKQGFLFQDYELATDEIGWSGGSYGGIFGLMMSVADLELGAVHVEGCGGPWRDIINTTDIAKLYISAALNDASGLALNAYDSRGVQFRQQVAELVQWIIDSGDVSSYAQHVLTSPIGRQEGARVLMQYWKGETLMPNSASERVARSLGAPWLQEIDSDSGAAGVWPYDVADYGLETGITAHGSFWNIEDARDQAIEFLRSDGKRIQAN
jgi:hypothetical protein